MDKDGELTPFGKMLICLGMTSVMALGGGLVYESKHPPSDGNAPRIVDATEALSRDRQVLGILAVIKQTEGEDLGLFPNRQAIDATYKTALSNVRSDEASLAAEEKIGEVKSEADVYNSKVAVGAIVGGFGGVLISAITAIASTNITRYAPKRGSERPTY